MKTLALILCLTLKFFTIGSTCLSQTKIITSEIKIEKSNSYTGKEMEALYIAEFDNTKIKRHFEVIKTNAVLKNFFLADYLLIERSPDNKIVYYPMGWTTDKIKSAEIKANCLLVINGKVNSVKIDS